jgi:outer membrane protein assembly factor BamB
MPQRNRKYLTLQTFVARSLYVLTVMSGMAASTTAYADNAESNWPSWRGPADNGSTEHGIYPDQLDSSTLCWKAALPGKGCSTPVIANGMIYLTAPIDQNDAVIAFDRDGNKSWAVTFGREIPGKHRNGSGCNASPVTDGKAVFVRFKSGTLAAIELTGKVRWQTSLVEKFGEDKRFWDSATSPVLTKTQVIVARMHAGDSWLAAFDKQTGTVAWKVPRNYKTPLEGDQSYTSPLTIQHQEKQAVLVWGTEHLTIHETERGQAYWSCGGFNPEGNQLWPAIATPVVVDNVAVVCHGRNDRRQPRLYGIRLDGSGDVTASNRMWERRDIGCFVPSPAACRGQVYLVRDRGEVECIDPATGNTIWSDTFPKGRASFYASPLIAAGKIYAAREDGVVFVASIKEEGLDLLSENPLQEPVIASPVPAENRIFIRGEEHLFCFGLPKAENDD